MNFYELVLRIPSTVYPNHKFLSNWDWCKSIQIVSNRQKSIPVDFVVQNSSTANLWKRTSNLYFVFLCPWYLYYKNYLNRFLPIWNDLNRFASVSIRQEFVVHILIVRVPVLVSLTVLSTHDYQSSAFCLPIVPVYTRTAYFRSLGRG